MDAFTGPDAVGIYPSGGADNADASASLGGVMSSKLAKGLSPLYTRPVQGLVVEDASPENGEGAATVAILNGNATYTPPDGQAGPAVAVAEGERKLLFGWDNRKYVRVYRELDKAFAGVARFGLETMLSGVISMADVSDADRFVIRNRVDHDSAEA